MSFRHWLYTAPLRLRSVFRRGDAEQEVDDELRYHVERQIETNISQGLTPEEARYAALRAIGSLELRKEECRDMRGMNFIDDLIQDVRYGFRGLQRNPGFTAVVVLTMALGIGANTAIFSIVNASLLRPLAYPDPDSLVVLESVSPSTGTNISVSPADYRDYRQDATTLEHLAGYYGDGLSFQLDERPETVRTARVTDNFFDALGIRPLLGRAFNPDEMLAQGPRTVVLSYRLWQSRFGTDPALVGKQVKAGTGSVTVLGVMPPEFKFPRYAEAWTPISGDTPEMNRRSTRYWQTIARLRGGQSIETARAEMTAIAGRLSDAYPRDDQNWKVAVSPLTEVLVRGFRNALLVLMGAVSIVLLIACANVSSLMLARSASRRREVGVRLALGASRWRLVRQLVVEGMLVSLLGAAAGLALAKWSIGAFFVLLPETRLTALMQLRDSVQIDPAVLVFTAGISMLTGIAVAVVPAWQSLRVFSFNVGPTGRIAMGAQASDVVRLVVGEGMRLSAAGLLIGLLVTMALTGLMKSLLFGVTPTDPLTLGGAALLLFLVAMLACYIPARRATRVDPMVALRHD